MTASKKTVIGYVITYIFIYVVLLGFLFLLLPIWWLSDVTWGNWLAYAVVAYADLWLLVKTTKKLSISIKKRL